MPVKHKKHLEKSDEVCVPECVVDDLNKLHTDFVTLTSEIKVEAESKPKLLEDFICHIKQHQAFNIDLQSVQTTGTFLDAIRAHYTFLNCFLIVSLASLLSNTIASKAYEYECRTITFMKSTTIFELHNRLKIHFQLLNDHKTQVWLKQKNTIIKKQNNFCYNVMAMKFVLQLHILHQRQALLL